MGLPAPELDDRRFQDLVDDAKRMVQRQCPEWTDHNVSDPGVTLIETFAYMVDQLLYRLNRVPERSYITFLELMGVELFPPSAARVEVAFEATSDVDEDRVIESGTEVATRRTRTEPAIVFRTVDDLVLVSTDLRHILTGGPEAAPFDQSEEFANERPVAAFSGTPEPGDLLFIGLDRAAPACTVALRVDCAAEGHGIDPTDPPWVWEALGDDGWDACEVDDRTGGFNEPGEIRIHIPHSHSEAVVEQRSGGWIRCRIVEPTHEDQTSYLSTPLLHAVSAATVGGTTTAVNGEDIHNEVVGVSEGTPGQRFTVRSPPVVPSERPIELLVSGPDGWQLWEQVQGFGESGPDAHHWRLDSTAGTVVFGPAVRQRDGSVRQYGAIPPVGSHIKLRRYRTGGGRQGNIAAGEIVTLKSALPFVGRVGNRRPAAGGVDGEQLEAAKVRGPLVMSTRNRAVTTRDYEQLAREASPEVARVRCLPLDPENRVADDEADAVGVRVLIVPSVAPDSDGSLSIERLIPPPWLMDTVRNYLDDRRMIGARVVITPPRYMGVTAVIRLRARQRYDPDEVRAETALALNRYFDPFVGGPDGDGWDFGRPILLGEVFGVTQRIDGVDLIEDARMFPANLVTEQRGDPVTRIDLEADSLALSFRHQIQVVDA